jgi:hypothetical protein
VCEPANWTDDPLKAIDTPVLVVGDHDEAIKRSHTEYIAGTIPGPRFAAAAR